MFLSAAEALRGTVSHARLEGRSALPEPVRTAGGSRAVAIAVVAARTAESAGTWATTRSSRRSTR
jgi:hypothetical protein